MHLDVNAASVEELEALGATVLDADAFRWTLMADPEGGEFCVFVREGEITQRLYEIGIDTGDSAEDCAPDRRLVGRRARRPARRHRARLLLRRPGRPGAVRLARLRPGARAEDRQEPVHLDVTTADLDALVAAGATVLRAQDDEIGWTVLADPDGNEFCAFADR